MRASQLEPLHLKVSIVCLTAASSAAMRGGECPPQAPGEGRLLAGGETLTLAGGGGPEEPLTLCKRGITSIHAHDCQEGGGLRASLSKELPKEDSRLREARTPNTAKKDGDDALWWTQ